MAQEYYSETFEKMLLKFMNSQDPMLSMLNWLCHKLMDAEIKGRVNAEKSERTEDRAGYRSGYRPRRFDTRMGTVYLMVPKIRNGGYVPFFVTERKRSEVALLSVIQEAYVNGVSTRKIEALAKSLGIESISSGQVSNITKELNSKVDEFRNRLLDKNYVILWVDALYEKIRDGGRVRNMAVLVITGLDDTGRRDILSVEPMLNESKVTYSNVFKTLKKRGLQSPWLVVSDGHQGLMQAVSEEFVGCGWQRCKVHFMRNILAHVYSKEKASFGEKLKQIWLQPDIGALPVWAGWLSH